MESGDVCGRVGGVGFEMQSRQISFYSKESDYIHKKKEGVEEECILATLESAVAVASTGLGRAWLNMSRRNLSR